MSPFRFAPCSLAIPLTIVLGACSAHARSAVIAHPSARPVLAVAAVTGPDHVGTIAQPVLDRPRHRELMIQIWYPTLATPGQPSPYYPPRVARLVASADHVPAAIVSTIATRALQAPVPTTNRVPVVLYSPGSGEMRNDATALVEDLASHGYIVITVDHTGESQFVQLPDGRIIPGTFVDTGPASNTRQLRVRVADIGAVLQALTGINRHGLLAGRLDLRHVGMFGFSLGGATAAAAMRTYPSIQAGIDLDGTLYGDALNTPLSRPFMLLGNAWHGTRTDNTWRAGWRELDGFRREIKLRRSGHLSFTDLAGFINTLHLRAQYSPTDQRLLLGSIQPPRAIRATRQLLTAFFDRFLRHNRNAQRLLDNPRRINPDLTKLR